MREPFFSVIIPVHSGGRLRKLERALMSVKRQTFGDWEAIVVDDSSPDNVRGVVEKVQRAGSKAPDMRFRYIRLDPPNDGYKSWERCIARNAGMQEARGTWWFWMDSDDEIMPNYMMTVANAARRSPGHWIFSVGAIVLWPDRKGDLGVARTDVRDPIFIKQYNHQFGKIGTGQFIAHHSLWKRILPLPRARTCYELADMAGIPGFGSDKRLLGNPWGDDQVALYRLVQLSNVIPITNHYLYIHHVR